MISVHICDEKHETECKYLNLAAGVQSVYRMMNMQHIGTEDENKNKVSFSMGFCSPQRFERFVFDSLSLWTGSKREVSIVGLISAPPQLLRSVSVLFRHCLFLVNGWDSWSRSSRGVQEHEYLMFQWILLLFHLLPENFCTTVRRNNGKSPLCNGLILG